MVGAIGYSSLSDPKAGREDLHSPEPEDTGAGSRNNSPCWAQIAGVLCVLSASSGSLRYCSDFSWFNRMSESFCVELKNQ